ncbi:hypothetical protein ABK040_008174 [Willaertia magna]
MSLYVANDELPLFRKCQHINDLIELNKGFLLGTIKSSPFTDSVQNETKPLVKKLIEINNLGLLTTNSSPGGSKTSKSYLTGIISGQRSIEKLEVILNQFDLVAFYLPCNRPGYKPLDDDDYSKTEELIKVPVRFKQDSLCSHTHIDRYVTCLNWITLLHPCLEPQIYEQLATHCYNVYIIDPVLNRSAVEENDGLLDKVINGLRQLREVVPISPRK